MAAKSLRDLNQKYRGKPKKFAEGGRARRPAAAPVPRPFDEDYLSILADRAVGAGEPVAELRSAEGRGFAPMPRSFGEAGQRLSAVIRGDVEPTPEEERQINAVRGFTEGPASIRAYRGKLPPVENSRLTQVATTGGTYQRAGDILRERGVEGFILDYGAGRGHGTKHLGKTAESFEPYPNASFVPTYTDPSIIPADRYAGLVNLNVLNVLPREMRDQVVREMGRVIKPEGEMIITTRGRDVMDARGVPGPEPMSLIIGEGERARYQKGFTPSELREYVQSTLGERFNVENLNLGPAGVLARRLYIAAPIAVGGLADLDEKYAEGGMVREPATAYDPDEIDRIVQEFAEGGEVEAPAETTINGQEHKLAYITDREAALLKARGGSGRMTKHGIRAYDEGPGEGPGSDNANSMSEAATQDAVGGNQGQGAGPTGAGAGGGPPGNDPGPTGEGQSEVNTPGMAPGISTAPTAVGPIGPEDEANAAAAKGAMANAPMGFEGYGIMDAIDAYNSGRMGLAQAIGYGIASVAAPPGVSVGFNVDPQTQTQTPAMSVSVPGVIGGLMGLATGVPGAGVIGGFIGNEIGKELGLDPTVMSYEPGVFNAPEPTPAYGAAGYGMDYGQGYAHGGLAKLHQKYAEGGEVEDDGGVERYDPREIDALASEFMAESNPADLMQRARLMMRGMNVGMPTSVGALNLSDNENVSTYTGLREMPIEDDRFARALRTLNTGINATLDQERGIRLGAGLQALQDAGDRGMSGYGANLSAGYGPVSLHGGYQSQLQAYPGAKPQEFYTYGGNLNIPLDDEGAKALLGAQVMSGRRGSAGAGNAGTLITGGLERPFRGGTLGVDVSVDPTLRNKEILFGYRRAF